VSRPEEARWTGRLDNLAEGLALLGSEHPVLVGIGRVFAGQCAAMDRGALQMQTGIRIAR
jgi:siroheme synthase